MSNGKVVLGVLAGIAAGAILGILFAPDKGCETRKKIAKKGNDVADELKNKVSDLITELTDKFESAIQEAKESGVNKGGN